MKAPKVKAGLFWIDAGELRRGNGGIITPGEMWGDVPVFILPADAESYERILNQFQYTFNRAPVGKEIEHGFRAIGITAPKRGKKGSK